MNFSYDELVRLENEAMKRVQKINESEMNTAKQINESMSPHSPRRDEIPKPKHISMPANINPARNVLPLLGETSSDSMLLMALILLLSREHTDTLLLLALVYVMM